MESVYIGSDHGGFELKSALVKFLKGHKYNVVDVGPFTYDKDDDYPDYAEKVCKGVISSKGRGILICKYSHGVTIAANKMPGIYASSCWNEESAKMAKNDGNTNVLCLSGMLTKPEEAERIVNVWLTTPFSTEERHSRRINKIKDIERAYSKNQTSTTT
jgi:ribose 5-phosphate isomerase B